jgi:uncharacterized protein (TIGR03435 family)
VPFPSEDPRDARAWPVVVEYPGGQVTVKGFTARGLIRWAYRLDSQTVIDVPAWMDHESIPITARTGVASPDTDAVLDAIRTTLDTELHVRLRREIRDYPVYALVLANADGRLGPNLRPAAPGSCVGGGIMRMNAGGQALLTQRPRKPACGVENSLTGPAAYGASIEELARAIQRPWLDRPVVDRTGLKGTFDMRLQLGLVPLSVIASVHPDATRVIESMGARSIQHALVEQLGLTLEDSRAPYDVIVVDGVPRPTSAGSRAGRG